MNNINTASPYINKQKKELLSDKVYKYLRSEIIKRMSNFDDDLVLSESYISKTLNVSRTPVREAINRLSAEGFVISTPNQGVVINKLSIKDLNELMEIRIAIEGLAVKLASKNIDQSKKKMEDLKKILIELKNCAVKKDCIYFSELDTKFHDIIVNLSKSKRLKNIYENLKDQYLAFRIKSFSNLPRLKEACKEIENILIAMEAKNELKAEELLREHVRNGYKNILNIYKEGYF